MAGEADECLPDLGVIGSFDPVAIDAATIDLLNERHGRDVISEFWPQCTARTQLDYGQQIGLGSTQYEVIRE
jgi:hypothetical protein